MELKNQSSNNLLLELHHKEETRSNNIYEPQKIYGFFNVFHIQLFYTLAINRKRIFLHVGSTYCLIFNTRPKVKTKNM